MIKGMDKLMRQLKDIENLDFVSAEKAGIQVIADEAQRLVPVDSGDLQVSITVEVQGQDVQLVAGGGDVDYALHVEMGTSKQPPQPYIRPAIDGKQNEALQAVARNLESQIRSKI